ncbi:hypothetical protein [Fructilactobacillus sanfranciscensis]|uniref:hypothetical protein n=1 Tax=Fructilactobacillus sanfranciscensis TaxID=1625 RepID=UPI0014570841|nr:hypothetical protein [Fructilactobacillus sanfranciscensis]
MTKSSKEVEKIEQLLADPWAVDIQEIWEQAAHNPDPGCKLISETTFKRTYNE